MEKKIIFFALLAPLLTGCIVGGSPSFDDSDGKSANGESIDLTSTSIEPDSSGSTNSDYTQNGAINILLSDGQSTTTDATRVLIDNGTNIVTIKSLGTYVITGQLTNGQLLIDSYRNASTDTIEIQLNGASIASSFGAPIFSKENSGTYKDPKIKIKRIVNSSSVIIDNRSSSLASSWSGEDTAAIFANSDLNIVGAGKLTVTSSFNNGIGTDDELKIKNGELVVSAPNNGLKAHDTISFGDSDGTNAPTIGITSTNGNAIRQDQTETGNGVFIYNAVLVATAKYDGIDAEQDIVCNDGTIQVVSGGGSVVQSGTSKVTISDSCKGIKATNDITINGGSITVSSHDDSLHSNANITINGGTLSLMSDDDGIHADTTFSLNDGNINISQSYEGIESSTINMNGGTTSVRARDDGWNAAGGSDNGSGGTWGGTSSTGTLNISGGFHYVNSVGDGLDSNGNIFMTGGTVVVEGPTSSNNGPLDYGDNNNYMQQDGGMIFAIGSSGMAVGASKGTQYSILAKGVNASSGEYYIVQNNSGTSLFAVKITQTSQSCYFSAPNLVAGTYKLVKGQLTSGTLIMNQFYSGGTVSSPTNLCSWTWSTSNVHATYGSSSGGRP